MYFYHSEVIQFFFLSLIKETIVRYSILVFAIVCIFVILDIIYIKEWRVFDIDSVFSLIIEGIFVIIPYLILLYIINFIYYFSLVE